MPSTYTLNNGIELIGTGEQSGTWGDTTNTNFELIDTALDGQVTVTLASAGTSGAPNTLPISDGSSSNGRNRMVIFDDGGDLGATAYVQLTPSDAEKIVYVRNDLSGSRSIILFQGTYNASNDYEVPAGTTAVVYFDGAGAGAVAANVFNNAYFDSLRLGSVSVTAILDEDDMASDSATALATQQSIKAYVDAQVTAQDLDFAGDSGTGAVDLDSQTFTIAGTANQITTAASAQTVTVSLPATIATTTADLTNLEVTNIKAKDGTASATIADSTGVMTIASSVLTTADINGGTVDGTVIGGSTPAAITGTTITGSSFVTTGDMTFGDNDKAIFGAGSDLQIYHNGANSLIADVGQGQLSLQSNGAGITLWDSANSQELAQFYTGAVDKGVTLSRNGSEKLATTSTGVDVTGTVTADGLTVDGDLTVDTDTLYVDSTNNYVGVGTTSPSGTLTVKDAPAKIHLTNDSNTGTAEVTFRTTTGSNRGFMAYDFDNDEMGFRVGGSGVAMTIDSGQRLLIGHTSSIQIGAQEAIVQVIGSGAGASSYSAVRYTNTSNSSKLTLGKSRAGSIGSNVIVQEDDTIGLIDFAADDGTNLEHQVASIQAQVDGVPGANDLPGRLLFLTTADGANSVTERMRISSTGTVTINTPTSGTALEVNIIDNTADGFVVQQGSNKYISVDTTNTDEEVILGNATTNPTVIVKGTNLNINSAYIDFSGSITTPSTAAAIYRPADNTLAFSTANNEAMRINSGQRVLIGETSDQSVANGTGLLQVGATDATMFTGLRYSTAASGPFIMLGKTRSGTVGTVGTIVQDDDTLGTIRFAGDDGADVNSWAAAILAEIDGTPGINDMPGRLVFETTADGASSSTERMRINSSGYVGINNQSPSVLLDVTSSNTSAETIAEFGNGNISNGLSIETFDGNLEWGFNAKNGRSLVLSTNQTEAVRIDSSQRVLIGHDSAIAVAGESNPSLQLIGSGATSNSWFNMVRFSNNAGSSILNFGKSRSDTIGTMTVVQSGDSLAVISAAGADGTDMASVAGQIRFEVDGTPGSNDMPGRIEFSTTADGVASPTERMRIDSSGNVLIATTTQNFSRLNFPQDQYIGFQSGNATVGGLRFEDNGGNGSAEIRFQGVGANQAAEIVFYTGDTNGGENMSERVRITDNGITFNGDTAAANALDDYEEGTWTPFFTGASGGITYSTQYGAYTKIGNTVSITMDMSYTLSSLTGSNLRIVLPFTAASGSQRAGGRLFIQTGMTSTNTTIGLFGYSGGTNFYFYDNASNVYNYTGAFQSGRISIAFTYLTS